MRDGKPVFPDVKLPTDDADGPAKRLGLSFGATSAAGNALGLNSRTSSGKGKRDEESAGGSEIIESDGAAKHKND